MTDAAIVAFSKKDLGYIDYFSWEFILTKLKNELLGHSKARS